MPVESVTYISDFDPNWPITGTDVVRDGAEHIRNVKSAIQVTFPNIDGEVLTTQAELNLLDAMTGYTGSGPVIAKQQDPVFTGVCTAALFSGPLPASDLTGTLPDARIAESNVTQHEAALTIQQSQIVDVADFLKSGSVATSLNFGATDTTVTKKSAGQIAVENDCVLSHESGSYNSAKVHFVTSVPGSGDGDDGDVFFVYTP